MARWPEKVYTTYKRMCKDAKKTPASEEDFVSVFKKQQRVLLYMQKLGQPAPWVIAAIDNKFSIYAALQAGTVVINILTQEEIKAFGVGEAGGRKRSAI